METLIYSKTQLLTLINQGLQSVAGTKNRINQRLPNALLVAVSGHESFLYAYRACGLCQLFSFELRLSRNSAYSAKAFL
ncbi:hypothetical protein BKM16_27735 [Pseudomonas amygdali pv. morsprunorum]|nr:hypothetical protein B5U27_08970 [Pseudomonas amygdali pv. lachrymans]KWS66412.1 hypothetical protein AL054_24920 [Pseudomonas amygdali pv. morsprunorum]KWS68632.1 hypothetical protein AL053_27660 [Pseudomonas savastanoi pv. fraxini]POC82179.1 hypothetical protein BKM08_26910 [Pseudomonas amygdali pv. morsprunorum]POC98315.1 hypothetical protein BKM22_26790 [Pseudomonas amygdali pv. morsprunorum]